MTTDSHIRPRMAPRGFLPVLATLGPGIVLAGGVVGTGELINTPVQAAAFGFILLWAVILSCLIKYFLQVEIGRHCLVHDRSAMEALNSIPGPQFRKTSWVVLLFILAWTIAQIGSAGIIGAIAGMMFEITASGIGDANQSSGGLRGVQMWAVGVVILAQVVMWRGLYSLFEKVVVGLVLMFSVTVVIGLVLLQGTDYAITSTDISSGLTFSLGENRSAAAFAVIALMGGLGVAGIELLVYPYWIREKGYSEALGDADSPGWDDRARSWIRILKLDALSATLLATVITASYFLLGAAILYRQGIQPQGVGVVNELSAIFTGTYGAWSRGLFLIGAFCTLASTLLHTIAANGRVFTDFFCSMGFVDRDNEKAVTISQRTMQSIFLVAALSICLLLPEKPEQLVILSQYIIGLVGTPIAIVAIMFLAFRTDRRVRMNFVTACLLLLTVAVILGCVGIGFAHQQGWIGGP